MAKIKGKNGFNRDNSNIICINDTTSLIIG